MKIFIKSILFYLLFTGTLLAYCDFESFKFGFKPDKYHVFEKGHRFEKILGQNVCYDTAYFDITFKGEFINGKLVGVNLQQNNLKINFLENIIHYYGRPDNQTLSGSGDGIDYYHWKLADKQIILKYHRHGEDIGTDLIIAPNNYSELTKEKTNK